MAAITVRIEDSGACQSYRFEGVDEGRRKAIYVVLLGLYELQLQPNRVVEWIVTVQWYMAQQQLFTKPKTKIFNGSRKQWLAGDASSRNGGTASLVGWLLRVDHVGLELQERRGGVEDIGRWEWRLYRLSVDEDEDEARDESNTAEKRREE